MSDRIFRWGIVGTGYAKEFAKGIPALPNAKVVAVASRYQERADEFAREFSLPFAHDSVEALAANPEVDVVYICSSPRYHAEHAMICLRHGKGVLVEKPFTIDAAEAEAVFALAKAKNTFCMEGLWSRFLPATQQVVRWLAEGKIGTVRQVMADFGFCTPYDPKKRHFDLEQRGGALLDVGCYSLAFTAMALGQVPEAISAQAMLCPTGADEQTAIVLKYPGGGLALVSAANRTRTPHRGSIMGTLGRIEVDGPTWAHDATLMVEGAEPVIAGPKIPLPAGTYQATETMRCMAAGLIESPLLPTAEILARMRIMDEVRRQIGVVYPKG